MSLFTRTVAPLAVLAALIGASLSSSAGAAHLSAEIYGLTTGNRLVSFSAASPGELDTNTKISGIRSSETVVGIDFRPKDGMLYAVTRYETVARLYTIDPETGAASFVATLVAPGTSTPIALSGSEFGVDFNPAADALRIVSDTGQNLRALPSDRLVAGVQRFAGDTFVDGTLNYLGETATGVTGAAYTNSDVDPATGTALYDIDTDRGQLALQSPPNDGSLVPVGVLNASTTPLVGFDIRTVGASNIAYASLSRQAGRGTTLARLYLVDLSNGALSELGVIGGPKALRDIAAAP